MNTCKCIQELELDLAKQNLELSASCHDMWLAHASVGKTLNSGFVIPLRWIYPHLAPKHQKTRKFFLVASFCPFCGKSIKTENITDPSGPLAHTNS